MRVLNKDLKKKESRKSRCHLLLSILKKEVLNQLNQTNIQALSNNLYSSFNHQKYKKGQVQNKLLRYLSSRNLFSM